MVAFGEVVTKYAGEGTTVNFCRHVSKSFDDVPNGRTVQKDRAHGIQGFGKLYPRLTCYWEVDGDGEGLFLGLKVCY